MKILLAAAVTEAFKKSFLNSSNLPNGLLFIAATLENNGHQVQIYDGLIDGRQPADFVGYDPDVIGFSVIMGPNIEASISQSKEFKRLLPRAKIIWGNVGPSALIEQTLSESYVDFVVIGEGEYTMLDLVNYLAEGVPSLESIKGLAFKINDEIAINEPRLPTRNMDELPDPAWHLVNVAKYRELDLNTSRGCAYHCTFCYNDSFNKGSLGYLSADRLVSQIEHLKQRYGAKHIRFNDDNFTFNRRRMRRFCNLLKERKIKITWSCDCRADLDEKDIALIAKSGCISVTLGFETGSQRMLDFIQKGTTVAKMEEAFWLFVKYKIRTSVFIMHGFPTEAVEDFKATDEMLDRMDNPFYLYNRFRPLPGTKLFDYCVMNGAISPPKKLEDWPMYLTRYGDKINLSNVPDEMINKFFIHYMNTFASNRFRFTIKHNLGYFKIIFTNPKKLFRNLWL